MEENELNREIGFVLEGMLRFQCGYYPASSDMLVEQNMLSIFNHAYYLCTLAAHDEQADTYFQNCDRYGARFQSVQVALVILALQAQKTELMKKILADFEYMLNALLIQIIHKFRQQGMTFRTDFTPCPPPISKLSVDWAKVTAMFNPDKVVKIISLWKTKDERRKVLHCIWRTAGILQDGASYSEACAYLRMLDQALEDGDGSLVNVARYYANEISRLNKELNLLKEEKARQQANANLPANTAWVRTVVDYAKGRASRNEAQPFLHMLEHIFRGTGTPELFAVVDEISEHFDRKEEKEKSFGISQTDTFINKAENIYLVPDQETLKRKQLG
jgi:hypothetical protein